jgi:RimJ/RimL family protein N-acetyltransferase
MDDLIALRPPVESDLLMLERLTRDPETTGEFAWFGYGGRPDWRQRWAENGLIGSDGGVLIVTHGDDPLGLVNWRKHQHTPAASSWEIGIALLPQARGKGYGTRAQRLLAQYLFAHTTAHRIWAGTETGNIAEQKALEKAGFTREGVQRGVGWRDGAWRDGVIYSLLRTDVNNIASDTSQY